jgi:hypothetical protein
MLQNFDNFEVNVHKKICIIPRPKPIITPQHEILALFETTDLFLSFKTVGFVVVFWSIQKNLCFLNSAKFNLCYVGFELLITSGLHYFKLETRNNLEFEGEKHKKGKVRECGLNSIY